MLKPLGSLQTAEMDSRDGAFYSPPLMTGYLAADWLLKTVKWASSNCSKKSRTCFSTSSFCVLLFTPSLRGKKPFSPSFTSKRFSGQHVCTHLGPDGDVHMELGAELYRGRQTSPVQLGKTRQGCEKNAHSKCACVCACVSAGSLSQSQPGGGANRGAET